jgi:hypothetical protein
MTSSINSGSQASRMDRNSYSSINSGQKAEQWMAVTTAKYRPSLSPESSMVSSAKLLSSKGILFSQDTSIFLEGYMDLECLLLTPLQTSSGLSSVAGEEFQIGFRVKSTSDVILFPQILSLHPILSLDVLSLPFETGQKSRGLLIHILIGSSNGEFALVRFKLLLDSWTFESLTENVY